jgi:hypothetical protein
MNPMRAQHEKDVVRYEHIWLGSLVLYKQEDKDVFATLGR